jgi:hypothetical protein
MDGGSREGIVNRPFRVSVASLRSDQQHDHACPLISIDDDVYMSQSLVRYALGSSVATIRNTRVSGTL